MLQLFLNQCPNQSLHLVPAYPIFLLYAYTKALRFKFRMVAITLRSSISADDNRWAAMCFDGGNFYFSKEYLIHIVDRVGAGDSFCGGLIYALLERYAPQQAIEFAAAASCLKHTIEGDFNRVSVQEVCSLVAGNASGRVQR